MNLKQQKEFIQFFQRLQEEKKFSYTNQQIAQLRSYETLLFDCFLWRSRNLYLTLFINFFNRTISDDKFEKQLISLRSNHIREFNELMKQLQLKINSEFLNKFEIHLNAFGFADIIDLIEEHCDSFVSDKLLVEIGNSREEGEIDENQLRGWIKKTLECLENYI